MTMMSLTQTGQPVSNGFRVDVSRGAARWPRIVGMVFPSR